MPPLNPNATMPYKVIVSTSFYEPAYLGGGPIQTLKALVNAAPENCDIKILCENHDLGSSAPLVEDSNVWKSTQNAQIMYVDAGLKNIYFGLKSSKDSDILYLNSFFNPRFTIFPLFLRTLFRWNSGKILLAPRGELDPGALALRSKKKIAYIQIFKALKFQKKVIWHASNELEAANIRNTFGNKVKIVIRENETSLDLKSKPRNKRLNGTFRLIFASRLHEKKGLHVLLKSLAAIQTPIDLSIIGAFEDSEYKNKCIKLVEELPDNINVVFHGSLQRTAVLEHFSQADLFAFPTAGENFGHVIAEALSQSCPVMCSTHTPWTTLLERGGGFAINSLNATDWSRQLQHLIGSDPHTWEEMSVSAGNVYNQWRSESKGEHVFTLTLSID